MRNQKDQMKWVLFWVFLVLFVLMVLGTLAMVFFDFGSPTESERSLMVKGLIGEVSACIIALFYSIFGLKEDSKNTEEINNLKQKIQDLSSMLDEQEFSSTASNNNSAIDLQSNSNPQQKSSNNEQTKFEELLAEFTVDPPLPVEEYKISPSAIEIINDLHSTKPFDLDHRCESYVGMKIQWKVQFYSISKKKDGVFSVCGYPSHRMFSVRFETDEELSHALRHMEKDELFWVAGEVIEMEPTGLVLKNVLVKTE